MYNGILNVYKEKGWTSHDVVNKLRRILNQKKIGHTGTLDPEAEGVLPVCLGSGTKLVEMLADHDKEYLAVLHLGMTTDTQDMTGEVLSEDPIVEDVDRIREVIMSFEGTYDQIPPMYSAIKVNGKKLCDLARKGIEIERETRSVTIDKLAIENIALPDILIRVSCSKGTYIRTLCHDIGQKLGCGACMGALMRTRVGAFPIDKAFHLSEVSERKEAGTLEEVIIQVDSMFPDAGQALTTEGLWDFRLHNGNPIEKQSLRLMEGSRFTKYMRIYDSGNCFQGLYRLDRSGKMYKPEKMFLNLG